MTTESLAAAGIAHDLNNQLTLILNYLDVSNLDGARAAAGRCTALTSSLLSWSRGETLSLAPLLLQPFLLDFADSLHLPDGIELTLDVPETAATVEADPVAMTRVLTNLVGNACDAMNGRGNLRISVSERTIEVSDSGPGIAPQDAQQVFEPFFTTKGKQGSGLGLAIVREIMWQHGGGVQVRSRPGRGTTFCLRFR